MTPKEQAQELFDKYKVEVGRFLAIQCALIAVDEILSFIEDKLSVSITYLDSLDYTEYWQKVKKEIEAL